MLVISVTAIIFIFLICFRQAITLAIEHRKKVRKFNEWSLFNMKLNDWGFEIEDPLIRSRYFVEVSMTFSKIFDNPYNFNIEDEKIKIHLKWGKYIPSLLQEVRDIKLNKIL